MASLNKCTPNTKLRKDKELLGPYLNQFLASDLKPAAKPVVFKSAQISRLPQKAEGKDFSAFHKKQGIGSLQDVEARREARVKVAMDRRKDRRTNIMMSKRGIHPEAPGVSLMQTGFSNDSLNASNTSTTSISSAASTANSRMEQLQRWKLQKAAKETTARNKQQQPRSGVPNKPALTVPLPPPNRSRNIMNVGPAGKKPPLPATIRAPQQQTAFGSSKPGERRVTRAMAKAHVPNSLEQMQPAIVKMKNLTLSSKVGVPKAVSSVAPTRAQRKPVVVEEAAAPAEEKSHVLLAPKQQVRAPSAMEPPPPPPQAEAPRRKKKDMHLDRIYVDFNFKLAEASSYLMNESISWKSKLEQLQQEQNEQKDLPEDVISEIESLVGSAKLLMDSKLPQFAQLLYFYLSKEDNPKPILPCDLEGWWDVAVIQIEKVKERFQELAKREQHDWREQVSLSAVLPTKFKQPMQNNPDSKVQGAGQAVKPKPKPQASSGLRAFLANKRRNALSDPNPVPAASPSSPPSSSENPVVPKTPSPPKPADHRVSPIREFEGGFFKISSPLRSSNKPSAAVQTPRVTALRRASTKTPVQRRSSIGTSSPGLVTLAVRKSMGAFSRIGAATPDAVANEAQNQNVSQIGVSEAPEPEDSDSPRDVSSATGSAPTANPSPTTRPISSYYSDSAGGRLYSEPKSCPTRPYSLSPSEDSPDLLVSNKSNRARRKKDDDNEPSSGIDNDSDLEFRMINLFSNKKCLKDKERSSSSSATSARHHQRQSSLHHQNNNNSSNPPVWTTPKKNRSKCTFSRSFHHFLGGLASRNNNNSNNVETGRNNSNNTRARARRKCEPVKWKKKYYHHHHHHESGSRTSPSVVESEEAPHPHYYYRSNSRRKHPGVIGEGRFKNNSRNTKGECEANSNRSSPSSGASFPFMNDQSPRLEGEGPRTRDLIPQPEPEQHWSPFSYDEMGLFSNNPQLRARLQSMYPSWPKPFVAGSSISAAADNNNIDREETRGVNNCCYSSYLQCDLSSPEPLTYCEIFGAQNVMDCYPEHSPFHDPGGLTLIESLISQQRRKPKSSWPAHGVNYYLLEHLNPPPDVQVQVSQSLPKRPGRGVPSSNDKSPNFNNNNNNFPHQRNRPEQQRINSFPSSSTTHSPRAQIHSCQVCNIYQSIRRKWNKYPLVASVNVSAECTYCGGFTDVTPRRSTRIHTASSANTPSISENVPSPIDDSASDV